MKRLFSIWAFLALLLAGGCSKYDDSGLTDRVEELEQRMKELETLCKETNTNISSLQTLVSAVQNGDYVKEVTPVIQDGKEIGYTITFEKCDPITIYHGKENNLGESGTMPVIGVRQDESGTFYWTLNGEWLLDDAGNKIKAQSTPPKLKLEDGYWYVSYDGEQTWHQFGKATSDDSDSMFQEVKQDDHNVYFTLASGEKITVPKTSELSISFQEGNTLKFNNVNETKTIHYTITGGGQNNIVKAEMLNADGNYTVRTTSASATAGTIEILAKVPAKNRVIVSVSDGNHTIMAAIDVSLAPSSNDPVIKFEGEPVNVQTPGTLGELLSKYDKTTITELTVIGSINDEDFTTLKTLPNLSALDIENTNQTTLPERAFEGCDNLTSIKLPQTLTKIGNYAFNGCSGLTGNLTIPNSVTTIGRSAFNGCSGLTGNLMIPERVTTIERGAFADCSGLTGNLTIPKGVTTIGRWAFSGCSGLTELTILSDIAIDLRAFAECVGLTNLTIAGDVIHIDLDSFMECNNLIDLIILEHVTSLDGNIFGIRSLKNIYCHSQTPPQFELRVLFSPGPTLYVPTGCAEAYRTAEGWRDYTFKDIIETNF